MLRPQLVVQDMPRQRRALRSPHHPFSIRSKPYAIVPFCIAPVLPGETLKSINWQSRIVTDPIKAKLVGWHSEFYWFYVKHRDLAERDTLTAMMTNPGQDVTSIDDVTTSTDWYHGGATNNINWVKLCYIAVIEEFFREEGENWNTATIANYAAARIPQNGWWDSYQTVTAEAADDVSVTVGVDDVVTMSELDEAMQQYELLRMQGLTTQTYEEYLMTYGVKPEQTQVNKPELLRYTKSWQYPTNIVEPTTGVPTSAVSWSIQERADKDRYFREPGFILGLYVARPKVYLSNQRGHMAALMNDVYKWLPATLSNPRASMKLIDNANAVTNGLTEDFWMDFRDLMVYGDQFVNFSLTDTEYGAVALPTAAGGFKYPTSTMTDALFSGTTYLVRQDGLATFQILGSVKDEFRGNAS